jgi:hypothetical protein
MTLGRLGSNPTGDRANGAGRVSYNVYCRSTISFLIS